MFKVSGNVNGIKQVLLLEIENLRNYVVPKDQIISGELLEKLAFFTNKINREIAIFIDRRGNIIGISIGDHQTVSLSFNPVRRSNKHLNGIRCIHTHPKCSGLLSEVDCSALIQSKFDLMMAVGVGETGVVDIYFAYLDFSIQQGDIRQVGPLNVDKTLEIRFDEILKILEIKNQEPVFDLVDKERAILIAICSAKENELDVWQNISELRELGKTAGLEVLESIIQKKDRPDTTYYLGKGKIKELALLVQNLNVNVVVSDDELTPAQQRNLETALGIKVIDRTVLILDIFAQRARSKEGKIQIELAQLNYHLPRLMGQGLSLSRLGGGIGTRGPGETKLEVDRRNIRKRISDLERELKQISHHRHLHRQKRKSEEMPIVALVGYTNAGKSTLTNTLINGMGQSSKSVFSADMLFATLDTTHRRISLPNDRDLIIADTVGFINKLPHHLIKAFRATLEEVLEADILLHVVDGSAKNLEKQIQVVLNVLKDLGATHKPILTVVNKLDLFDLENSPYIPGDVVFVSAVTGQGIEGLISSLKEKIPFSQRTATYLFPYEQGNLMGYLHQNAQVISQEYCEDGIIIEANLKSADYERLKEYLLGG